MPRSRWIVLLAALFAAAICSRVTADEGEATVAEGAKQRASQGELRAVLVDVCRRSKDRQERLDKLVKCFKEAVYGLKKEPGGDIPGERDLEGFLDEWLAHVRQGRKAMPQECAWLTGGVRKLARPSRNAARLELTHSDDMCMLPYLSVTNTYRVYCPGTRVSANVDIERMGGVAPMSDALP